MPKDIEQAIEDVKGKKWMKEYEIDHGSFMGGWYIPEEICDDLIELYHASKNLHMLCQTLF